MWENVVEPIGETALTKESQAILDWWNTVFLPMYDKIKGITEDTTSTQDVSSGGVKDTARELGDLTETLDKIVEKYDLLKDAQDQFKESGTLSAATLSGIMEKFESMEEPVALYIAGLKTEKELLKDLQNAYDAEEQDYYDTIKSKLEYSAEYCDSLDEDQIKLIKDFGATYDVDFGNFKTLAEAKIKLQEKLTEKLGEINAKYVGASLEELKAYRDLLFNSAGFKDYEQDLPESMRTGNDLQDAMLAAEYKHKKYFEEVAALNNTINAMEKAMKAFDELAYDPDGWDPSKFSEDAQDAAKEAEDAFEKLKEKLKDWFSDMEFQVEIRFNAGDIEGTTELYQQMIAKARELLDSAYNMGLNIEDEWVQELITKVNTYKKALADLRTEEYDKLIEYNDKFDVWNHVSYSKLDKLEEKLEDINEQYREGLITYQDYYDAFMDTAGQIYDIQKESLETLLEEVMNALEADNKAQVEALEEQADAIQKIIDLKKQLLEETRDQEDHEREVADKVRTIAKLQERISQLKLDDSREATAERLALEEELYTAQQELAELQGDYAVDQTINALDKQAEEYEDYYDEQIEAIEDQIDQETELRQKAIELINSDYRNMMNDVKGYFKELGYTISDDLLEPLRQGLDLVSQYGDYTGATSGISQNAAAGLQSPKTVASIVAQMKQNSAAWHGADKSEQNRLSDKNANLGQQLREMGLDVWRENSTGIWWIRINGQKQKLFDAYHIGGTVGAPTAKSNEIFAMLKKGEVVLTGNQQDSLLNIIKTARDFVDNMMATTFGAVTNRMKSFSPAAGYNTGIGTYSPNIEVNIAHNGSMSDADAKRYGNTIAETALDKLWETMQKRGMTK